LRNQRIDFEYILHRHGGPAADTYAYMSN
jgi:hypothetical protein